MRLLLLSVGLVALGMISAPAASASCAGASTTFTPQDVDRGGHVTVTGKAWGDDCYDTGPPPDGEGVLGRPLEGIEIVVVQGEREWVLETVDAGGDYGFVTRVTIPHDADPGEARLFARMPDWTDLPIVPDSPAWDPPLVISTAPPVTSSSATDTTIQPIPQEPAEESSGDSSSTELSLVVAGAAVVAALAAGAWGVTARQRSTR